MNGHTKSQRASFICLIWIVLWASTSAAAEEGCLPAGTAVPPSLEAACQESVRPVLDPSLDSPTRRNESPGARVSTRNDESAAIEFRVGTDKSCSKCLSTIEHALKLSGPIGSKDQEADLATLDGLRANTNLSYVISWRSIDPLRVLQSIDPEDFHNLLCKALKDDGTQANHRLSGEHPRPRHRLPQLRWRGLPRTPQETRSCKWVLPSGTRNHLRCA